jgi:uncharacterized membrane protein
MPAAFTSWVLAVPLLGFATGLRTITPIAVLCWFAWLGYLPVEGTWAFWTANLISVVVFTLLALGEYIGDKLPQTPNRTALGPLLARLLFGGFVASIVATSIKLPGLGLNAVVLGIAGAAFSSVASSLPASAAQTGASPSRRIFSPSSQRSSPCGSLRGRCLCFGQNSKRFNKFLIARLLRSFGLRLYAFLG